MQLVGNLPQKPEDIGPELLAFGFSFLILINVWNRFTSTTSVMPVETALMVRLNMLLLFLVAIEPFLFDIMSADGFNSTTLLGNVGVAASVYYAFDIAGMNLILGLFTHILASEEKNLIPKELIGRYKTIRDLLFLGGAMFLVSALPVFWAISIAGVPGRILIWFLTIPEVWTHRMLGFRSITENRAKGGLGESGTSSQGSPIR